MFESVTGRKRLICTDAIQSLDSLLAQLTACAVEVEDAMIDAGAVPGQDYKILDVFQLAASVVPHFLTRDTYRRDFIGHDSPYAGIEPRAAVRLRNAMKRKRRANT